jgi:hypothetical protein
MTAGRPIGERIRDLCEHLDAKGPQGISTLREKFRDVERSNISKYCSRAVGLGLLTVERKTGARENRHVWTVVPEWRELIEQRRTTRIKVEATAKRTRWTGVSSVFSMGAM